MTWAKNFPFLIFVVFLISCATSPYHKVTTIAVWDLDNLCPSATAQPDLGELLSSKVIETFQKKENYIVVERERLLLALEELNLGTTSVVDESTRLKLGKLVGARYMVFGCYQMVDNTMRIDLRLIEVETGKVIKAAQKTTSNAGLQGWLDTARKVAEEL